MYARLLQIREFADVSRYLEPISRVERQLGRFLELRGRNYGSNVAPAVLEGAAAASARFEGLDPGSVEGKALGEGYADTLRVVMAHGGDLPFTESQIKYVHSLILRHDAGASGLRRKYRTGPPPESAWPLDPAPQASQVPEEVAKLVAWTRSSLETHELHPLLTIAVFSYGLLVIRPFGDGNGRLARALTIFLLDISGYSFVQAASLDAVVEARREACAQALAESGGERGDATRWVHFVLETLAEVARLAVESLEGQPRRAAAAAAVADRPQARPAAVRLTPRQSRIVDVMRDGGPAKIGELLGKIESPRATLKKDLRGLVEAGVLVTTGLRKGTVYYLAAD